ncbi:MAG: hypothetical protein AVDCRST_MAG10-2091 [uncultured Acidimicrobiales bacterium]|uniref:Uncharacterized protein n=1 Tax=uncultured Acidimicrobiales bacterium TaxID=310071 RepID=A0A6J4IFF9_9ACTN|nr:MAG: hypothetical protein AVDCRST_MAG10-2091 [uncultured Acidimicrobiales bacterium]
MRSYLTRHPSHVPQSLVGVSTFAQHAQDRVHVRSTGSAPASEVDAAVVRGHGRAEHRHLEGAPQALLEQRPPNVWFSACAAAADSLATVPSRRVVDLSWVTRTFDPSRSRSCTPLPPTVAVTVPGAKGVTVTFVLPQHGGLGVEIDVRAHSGEGEKLYARGRCSLCGDHHRGASRHCLRQHRNPTDRQQSERPAQRSGYELDLRRPRRVIEKKTLAPPYPDRRFGAGPAGGREIAEIRYR